MKNLIVSGSPRRRPVLLLRKRGAPRAQTQARLRDSIFCPLQVARCAVAATAGAPAQRHTCLRDDGFTEIQKKNQTADKLIQDTPSIWAICGAMKAFFARFPAASRKKRRGLDGRKQVLLIASRAGRDGMISCLER